MRGPVVVTGLAPDPLEPAGLLERIARPDCGAVVAFEGRARSPHQGRDVVRLEYEAYEERARAQLRDLAHEVMARFALGGVVAVHRLGPVEVGQPAVVVAAAAVHRREAFAACEDLIDRVKAEAAIWKKEVFRDGACWVGTGDR